MKDLTEKVFLKKESALESAYIGSIICAEKVKGKVKIETSANNYLVNRSLACLEQKFGSSFFRIRQNVIINLTRIKTVDIENNKVVMDNNNCYIIAKRKKKDFLKMLDKYTI